MPQAVNGAGKRRLRFGIIGCGGVVQELHLPAWRAIGGVEVAALCDSSAARMAAVGVHYPGARRYQDTDELLYSASDLDFVVLATPGPSHRLLAERIIAQGLHLLCEKPLALELGDARHLFELAARHGVVLTCLHNYRFKENVQQALCRRRELGDLVAVNVCFRSGPLFKEQPAWRRQERQNRILLFEIGIHFVDLALLFLGPLVSLRSVDAWVDQSGIQRVVFTTLHQGGCSGLFELMVDASNCKTEIEILGERRSMALQFFPDGFRMLPARETPAHRALADIRRLAAYARDRVRKPMGLGNVKARPHAQLFRGFISAVRGHANNPVAPQTVLATIALLDQVAARAYGETSTGEHAVAARL